MLTVFVVVAHLGGFLAARSGTGSVNGLFDDLHVRLVGGTRSRGVDGVLVNLGGALEAGAGGRGVDGELVNGGAGLEAGAGEAGAVNGRGGGGILLAVVGLDAGTVLALSYVDDGVVRAVVGIELDTRLGVGRLGSDGRRRDESVTRKEKKEEKEEVLLGCARHLACFSFSLGAPRRLVNPAPLAPDRLGEGPKQGGRWRPMEQKGKGGEGENKSGSKQKQTRETHRRCSSRITNSCLRMPGRRRGSSSRVMRTSSLKRSSPRGGRWACAWKEA